VTEVAPGDTVTVRAQPAGGYVFAGWTNGCKGSNPTCTVSAGQGNSVTAKFNRRGGRATVAIRIRDPRIKARFKQSSGSGTLVLNGSISRPASLRVQLRRPGGGALLTRKLRALGPFGRRYLLKRGTLAGGAYLFPGGFVVTVRGRAGSIPVPLQMRSLYLNPPLEGVVRRTYAATTPGGRPQKTLARGTKQAWAIFRFASQPTASPLTVTWYDRNGALLGSKAKNNRPVLRTGISSGSPLPSGIYRVDLKAGGKLTKTYRIRIR
jgi:uncharacterized repeat protein (TIGR02543 family)